jgi:hypothetical protein
MITRIYGAGVAFSFRAMISLVRITWVNSIPCMDGQSGGSVVEESYYIVK